MSVIQHCTFTDSMFGLLRSRLRCNVVNIFERTMAFYAVAKGRKVGIYANWAQCEEQVKGFKGAVYKKFNTRFEAELFINPAAAQVTYEPAQIAVALGQKQSQPNSWTVKEEVVKAAPTDFWPEENDADELITEDELMSAMNEVEGFTPSSSRKRKTYDSASTDTRKKLPRHASNVEEVAALKEIGDYKFKLDSEGYVIVYTDGSCLGNGKVNACAGFGVYFDDHHPLNAGLPVKGRVTNNVGEIQAAIYAIKKAREVGINKLCISTDSQFLINSITMWVQGWKKRGWLLKNNEPVKNVADFKELDELLQKNDIRVKWNYVEAHKGIKGNEMADQLAKQGSYLYRQRNSK